VMNGTMRDFERLEELTPLIILQYSSLGDQNGMHRGAEK